MKKYILTISILCLVACKTRQVSIDKTNTTDRSVKTEVLQGSALHLDTGKSTTHIISQNFQHDSVQIEIVPDTGIIQITNGNYIGKARNIVIKGISSSSQATDHLLQQQEGSTTLSTLRDSTTQKNNIQTQNKTKQITAKGLSSWIYWSVGLMVLAVLGWLGVKKFL
ncbi:hypothetical protein ACFGVR_10335 [Mucilaginibacter sp. AW1-3]